MNGDQSRFGQSAAPIVPRGMHRIYRETPPRERLKGRLPDYAASQAAYHRAFRTELQQMLAEVFQGRIRTALDIACGDGAYSGWLSRRFGIAVFGLDTNFSFLRLAQRRPVRSQEEQRVLSLAGNALMLPFADESFDAVWCAQSLYSLPNSTAVLEEMRRVTRPGGTAAVLENDTLHELILPWPPDLELAIRQAEWASFCREMSDPEKFYLGRYLPEAFRSAGFSSCSLKTYAVSRAAPIDDDVRDYLQGYLSRLRESAAPYLSTQHLERFDQLLNPGGTNSLIDRADFNFTCLIYVAAATKSRLKRKPS